MERFRALHGDVMEALGLGADMLRGIGGRVLSTNGQISHRTSADQMALLHAALRNRIAQAPAAPPPPYTRRISHPRKLAPGFRRNVDQSGSGIDGPLVDLTGEVTRAPSPSSTTAAVCASCGRALTIGAAADGRPYALKCGHLIDAPCLYAARARRTASPGSWRPWRGRNGGKSKQQLLDDAEYEPEPMPGRWDEAPAEIVGDDGRGWQACPVDGCDSCGTDLLAEGVDGPWELFV